MSPIIFSFLTVLCVAFMILFMIFAIVKASVNAYDKDSGKLQMAIGTLFGVFAIFVAIWEAAYYGNAAANLVVQDAQIETITIDSLSYEDNKLDGIIDNQGQYHKIYDSNKKYDYDDDNNILECSNVILSNDDKLSYTITTETGRAKLGFIEGDIKRITYDIELPKKLYYDYKYSAKLDGIQTVENASK